MAATLIFLRTQAIESGMRLTESFARVVEEQTNRTIQTIDQRLQLAAISAAQLDAAGRLNEQSARALLREQIKDLPFVRAMWVMDAQGRIKYDSDVGNIGINLADRAYFQIYVSRPQTMFYIGNPVRSRTTGTWLISAARPLQTPTGAFAGVIVAAVEPPYFEKLWRTVDLGAGGSIALWNRDGVMMMRSPLEDAVMGKSFSDSLLFRQLLPANPAGNYQQAGVIDGVVRLLSYRTLSARPELVVVVGQSYHHILAPWRRLSTLALAIWAAAAVGIILLCWFLNRAWQQQRRSEAEVAQMAQRLGMAADAADIGIWDWNLTTDQWYATPTYFTMLGYDAEDGFSDRERWLERVHPDDRDAVAEKIGAVLAANGTSGPVNGRKSYQYEARLRHVDGSFRWVSVIGSVLAWDAHGKPTRMLGVRIDITERKRAETSVSIQTKALEMIAQGLPPAETLTAMVRQIEASAPGMRCSVLLLEEDGIHLRHCAAPSLPEAYLRAIDGLAIGPNAGSCGTAVFRREQVIVEDIAADPIWADYRALALQHGMRASWATPIFDEQGHILGSFAIYYDQPGQPAAEHLQSIGLATHIAALALGKQRRENALRKSEERFRSLSELSSDWYWEQDAQFRFVKIGGEIERQTGIAEASHIGLTRWELPDANLSEADWDAHKAVLRAHLPFRDFEFQRPDRAGQSFWMSISGAPVVDAQGTFTGYRGVGKNITERKLAEAAQTSLEAQLRESQKMEAIGTLAGGIAHDFNNLIAAILGNTDLARQDMGANPRALESLDEIRKAGWRARDLVQQILSFSRRQPAARKPIALMPIIEESVRLLRAVLPARLTLTVHNDANVPAVLADATQIEQIMLNLATNSMQAMRGGPGHIDIRLDVITLDAATAGTHPSLKTMRERHAGRVARLAVRDNGQGMDAATLERIFEPFFTTKPVGEGTGLGLSVVLGIVQSHEGAVVVDSEFGKGTTFTIYLPAADAQAAAVELVAPDPADTAAAPTPAQPIGTNLHILYIDDDQALVFLVKRLLERRGYRVSGYVNQREALDALRADPEGFSLVLSDYNMPGMSGLEVAREVRAICADLPVAIASGFIDDALRAQADEAGVRELIFKANVVEDFCSAIEGLLGAGGRTPAPS